MLARYCMLLPSSSAASLASAMTTNTHLLQQWPHPCLPPRPAACMCSTQRCRRTPAPARCPRLAAAAPRRCRRRQDPPPPRGFVSSSRRVRAVGWSLPHRAFAQPAGGLLQQRQRQQQAAWVRLTPLEKQPRSAAASPPRCRRNASPPGKPLRPSALRSSRSGRSVRLAMTPAGRLLPRPAPERVDTASTLATRCLTGRWRAAAVHDGAPGRASRSSSTWRTAHDQMRARYTHAFGSSRPCMLRCQSRACTEPSLQVAV